MYKTLSLVLFFAFNTEFISNQQFQLTSLREQVSDNLLETDFSKKIKKILETTYLKNRQKSDETLEVEFSIKEVFSNQILVQCKLKLKKRIKTFKILYDMSKKEHWRNDKVLHKLVARKIYYKLQTIK